MLVDDVQKFIGFHSNAILVVSLWIFQHIFIFFSSYRASPFIFFKHPSIWVFSSGSSRVCSSFHIESPSILLWNIWMRRHVSTWVILKMTPFIDVYSKVKPQYLETHPFAEQKYAENSCCFLHRFSTLPVWHKRIMLTFKTRPPNNLFHLCNLYNHQASTKTIIKKTSIPSTYRHRMTSSTVSIASINAAWIE